VKVIIKDQSITVLDVPTLVSNSINTYYVVFEFDESWGGFDKTVVFNNGVITKEIVPEQSCCAIPWEVLTFSGFLKIGIRGVNGETVRPTIWSDRLMILEGPREAAETRAPTPSVYQKVIAEVKKLAEREPGVNFITDETLSLSAGILSVNTAGHPEQDNTLPITAAAVYQTVGNIEVLLRTI